MIKKTTLDAQFAEVLRDDIVSGRLKPGSRLTELQLAEESELSRGTVRAALRRLVSEELVVQMPYTGWEVVSLNSRDVWELFTLRRALEGLASRLVTEQMSAAVEEKLVAAFDDLVGACSDGNKASLVEKDAQLHRTIVDLSGHSRLIKHYEVIQRQVCIAIAMSDALVTDADEIASQHRPIVDSILSGDAETAEKEAQHHTDQEGHRLVNSLREKEEAA